MIIKPKINDTNLTKNIFGYDENLKKYIYRLKKIEMCNYAVLVDLDTNKMIISLSLCQG